MTYHFNDFHFGSNTQMVEERFQVLLHLNGIVFHLSNGKDSQFAVLPGAMLFQEEWQQHQQPTVVNNPPDVDVAADLEIHFGVEERGSFAIGKWDTFSVESGKKLIPFGITRAIRDDVTTRHVSKKVFHVRSDSL